MSLQKRRQLRSPRLLYIENLRILLSALVVVVHVACSYGGPGGWSYMEKGAGLGTILPLTILNATSQSFFMGMFFFIGAYFTHKSFQKKGLLRFVKERIIRLGIPLAIYYFFISVLDSYITWPVKHPGSANLSFVELWLSGRAFSYGVMWFVLALSYFTFLYLIARMLIPSLRDKDTKPLPKIKWYYILLSAVLIGIATYITRIRFPLFKGHLVSFPLDLPFDLGHFPQYIFLFILGIIAARYDSDYFVSYKQAKNWLWFVLTMVLLIFPLMFFVGQVHINGVSPFAGRGTWHSLAYSVWEQVTGIAIMVSLMGIFKTKWNWQSKFAGKLSESAFAVYALHPPVLVGISIFFINWDVMLLIKFLALTPLALVGSFVIALLVKRVPVLRKIF